ncbi:MAG TPA: SgcJ/EcaC family oxidoreductase [Sphingomicrobium sp.]|jgi:uncharacterized protein (TIGR02246 family)|nr:SgcJ/EcaC family oxidoreductase [Sphingomicrobium sp.]
MRAILTCAAVLACAACQQKTTEAPAKPDAAADTQAIETVEQGQITAIGQKNLDGATTLYADDAVFIGEDGKAVRGKDSINAMFKDFLADPAQKIDYQPGQKTLSSSGDMAYSTASFTETYTDPKTKKPVTLTGTNLSVWKKQADGSWKLVADSNPGAPADAE